eukprot:TRINITY_DN3124_c0_g1_i2.p1 TRINITY_DN3124_c0_g1~~TRINITY_DN3124_c0_g1_i2.p1  ORF type:complete len:105 (+),score=42.15 TRINITY_DN3124_c0_g1_i2:181-495(+)
MGVCLFVQFDGEMKEIRIYERKIDSLKEAVGEVLNVEKEDVVGMTRIGNNGDEEEEVEELLLVEDEDMHGLKWNDVLEVVLKGMEKKEKVVVDKQGIEDVSVDV